MNKRHIIMIVAGLLVIVVASLGYIRRTVETANPTRYLAISAPPWMRPQAPEVVVTLKNNAWLTTYCTGLLIIYMDKVGKKLGTDRFNYTEPISPGQEATFRVPVHPDIYPLQTSDQIRVELEFTSALE
ncbi:MAG TPA: hypothetical protein PLX35_17515 [Cyclobacteriaceae bacterium]|nr:hypothetical protein [Cyclobacteriaceae bacterium]